MKYTSSSLQDTNELASSIIKLAQGTNLIALYGNLGAGKTTFAQALARHLGVTQRVLSPTYVLMRQYDLASAGPYRTLIHLDLYRLQKDEDFLNLDLSGLIQDQSNLVIIEWAEKAAKFLPCKRLDIKFLIKGKNQREIIVNKLSK